MRRWWTAIGLLGLLPGAGCVTRAELAEALADDVRYTSRVVGFALDAQEESLRTRRLLLEMLADHPRAAELRGRLEPEALEAKAERVATARRELVEEGQRLLARWQTPRDD